MRGFEYNSNGENWADQDGVVMMDPLDDVAEYFRYQSSDTYDNACERGEAKARIRKVLGL